MKHAINLTESNMTCHKAGKSLYINQKLMESIITFSFVDFAIKHSKRQSSQEFEEESATIALLVRGGFLLLSHLNVSKI